jgi:hypothetical protein
MAKSNIHNSTLRDMYEDCLRSQLQANFLMDKDGRHCWFVREEKVVKTVTYNWIGEVECNESHVVSACRYVWLGAKGAITVTKGEKFRKNGDVVSTIEADLKRWARKEYGV